MWHITRLTRSSILKSALLTDARAIKTTGSRSLFYNWTKNRKSIIINSPRIFVNAHTYCTAPKNNSSAADLDPHNSLPRRFAREIAQYFQKTAEKARASEGLFGYIVTHAPAALQPYLRLLRLDKPIGVWLLYWPCTWGITLALGPSLSHPEHIPHYLYTLALFLTGAVLARGAGCIINDMWDRNFDRLVTRTRTRPLASGEVTMTGAATALLVSGLASLAVLLQLPTSSIVVGLLSAPLVIIYPAIKRVSYWPQLVLGLAFNWGVLLGWSVALGDFHSLNELFRALTPVIGPYMAGVAWTLIYDTIYAHQDKADDQLIGVKSTALRFGSASKQWFTGFAATMMTTLAVTGVVHELNPVYYFALIPVAAHLYWQIRTLDINNGPDCAVKFRANHFTGMMIWLALLLGVMY